MEEHNYKTPTTALYLASPAGVFRGDRGEGRNMISPKNACGGGYFVFEYGNRNKARKKYTVQVIKSRFMWRDRV